MSKLTSGIRLSLIAGSVLGAAIAASAQEQVIVRAPLGVTPEAERLLAESVEPRRLDLMEGDDLLSVARRDCGRLTATYVDLLLAANESQSTNRMAIVPACFVVRTDESVNVREGDTWASLASREVGVAGNRTLGRIFMRNAGLGVRSNAVLSSEAYIPSSIKEVTLPVTTEAVSYVAGPNVEATTLASRLREALNTPPGAPEPVSTNDELVLEAGILSNLERSPVCPETPRARGAWPFPSAEVIEIISRNEILLGPGGVGSAIVAVVDNGIDGVMTDAFPLEEFAVSALERNNPNDRIDQDGNGFFDDVVGTNIHWQGPPVAYPDAPEAGHGTMMASLALGGTEFRNARRAAGMSIHVRIRPISIVRRTVEGSPEGNVVFYRMPSEGLFKAVNYADLVGASIVNLSVSNPNRPQPIVDALYNRSNLLLIVAAGNGAVDLDDTDTYPASLSRDDGGFRGRVITVAAHNQDGCLSGFSGRGRETVDLAAPGEDILAIGMGGAQITDEGTSQATALVSFTAGQLRAAGLIQAAAIKERLIASVDLVPGLELVVRWGGTLNVPKALSINEDVLELTAGERVYGLLAGPLAVRDVCPAQTSDQRRILKVSRSAGAQAAGNLRLLVRDRGVIGAIEIVECAASPDAVSFTRRDGTTTTFLWDEISDLVPRT